ncbi:MAG: phenylalanine--tRNA ligase subunit beta, partial [Acetobacteraceae bacterium]|nr:phenylalanine--tRNA ligase subunit beta [Acetobacteraceae bacterium]
VAPEEAIRLLGKLGFLTEHCGAASVTVAVPSWRNDIAAPIVLDQASGLDPAQERAAAEGCAAVEAECDLIEEVLRLHGLDRIAPVSMPRVTPVPQSALSAPQIRIARTRRSLAVRGLAECVSFSFLAQGHAAQFGTVPERLHLLNPIASDLDQLRPTPLASLVLAAQRNAARGFPNVGLFEIGPGFADDTTAGQLQIAAGLRAGSTPRSWIEPARGVDMADAQTDLFAALEAVGMSPEALAVTADAPRFYHPGRSGVVRQGPKTVLGTFGELHPAVLRSFDVAGPAVGFELFLDAVPERKRGRKPAADLPPFQPVCRDFAFVVDREVAAEAVLRAARGAGRGLITAVTLFDVYEGENIPQGKKSLAIEVVFQPRERTLTDAEIEAACQKVIQAVTNATGAVLR